MTAFKKKLKRNYKLHRTGKWCCSSKDINILVSATMSAGKTSLVNALLGTDLLWSSNEAATSTITRIHHMNNSRKKINGSCQTWDGKYYNSSSLEKEHLREWNDNDKTKEIDIYYPVRAFNSCSRKVVICDTPGGNNSQNALHSQLFAEAVEKFTCGLLLYVLNATQLGTNDDVHQLAIIRQHMDKTPNVKIAFVLNKMDALDEDKGETANKAVDDTLQYLKKAGFVQPVIIPAIMNASLIAYKLMANQPVTRAQKNNLKKEIYNSYHNQLTLINSTLMPGEIKLNIANNLTYATHHADNNLSKKELNYFITYSGLKALESYLQYHFEIN